MELLRMPRASENMVEGTVGTWLVMEGSAVEKGTHVVEIITEKAQFELESASRGILSKVLAPTRATVPVNYILAVISEDGAEVDLSAIEDENRLIVSRYIEAGTAAAAASLSHSGAAISGAGSASRVQATPRARKLARDSQANLEDVRQALGLSGIIEEEHVRRYLDRKFPNNTASDTSK